jgi:fatty acid elongase 3
MAPIADFILANVPLPKLPSYLTRWEPGVTPLSTQKEVATALVSYLAIIFGIQAFMKNKTAVRANGPFQVHNTILYVGSGILLVLMIEEVLPLWWKGGWFFAICNDNAWTQVKLLLYSDQAIFLFVSPASRVLLYDQLLLQIPRAHRYRLPCYQEEDPR